MNIQGYFDEIRSSFINYSFFEKLVLSAYAFSWYIFNIFYPVNLSATYPLIPANELHTLPFIAYILIPVIYLWILLHSLKKDRIIGFGLLFFLVCIGPVLDHSSVGKFVMADRFAYVASLGIITSAVVVGNKLSEKYKISRILYLLVLFLFSAMYYFTFKQCSLWKNQKVIFTHALTKGDFNPVAYCELGTTYLYEKSYDTSEMYLRKAIEQYPKYSDAYLYLGKLYTKMEIYNDALSNFNLALKHNYSSDETVMNIGIVMLKMENYHNAISFFNQVIKTKNDELLAAYLNRAEAKLRISDIGGAKKDCEYYLDKDPTSPAGNFAKAKILEVENPEEALVCIDYTITHDSLNEDYYYTRAQIKGQKLADLQGSLSDLNKVLEINPDHYRALSEKGIIMLQLGGGETKHSGVLICRWI
jgi:protein O-mannosyl-transferase